MFVPRVDEHFHPIDKFNKVILCGLQQKVTF